MTMVDSLISALFILLDGVHFFYLTVGVLIGLVVGILPGLGGVAGFSLVLPFIFGMDPVSALALMIGLLSVVMISDTFTSVLMGIPGSAASQATVLDGYPLARKGEAARALGAAFSASLFGGLFGAVVLTLTIFVARPIILAIGFGEQLMLILLGLSMVGVMTGTSPAKGLATCGLGLLLGCVGAAPATSEWRFTMGSDYLIDGIPLVVVALGVFALPEMIDLMRRDQSISGSSTLGVGWRAGLRDTVRNHWLVLRCSAIGCLIGALPGLGGAVVDWVTYGHAVQTEKNTENFGKGDIRGVIAPESANNAKEGGALIPTILFGIPGSGGMAVFLGGMILIGIQPGITMVDRHLDLVFTIIWSLALANVIGTGICLVFAQKVALLTTIRYALLAPVMIMLIYFAAYQATRQWGDILALTVIGVLGVYMKRFGWPRPALLIGFVLSSQLETTLYKTIQVYGFSFLQRPLVLVFAAVIVVSVYIALRASPARKLGAEMASARGRELGLQITFSALVGLGAAAVLLDSFSLLYLSRLFPLGIAGLTLALVIYVLVAQVMGGANNPANFDSEIDFRARHPSGTVTNENGLLWILGMLASVALFGFTIGILLFFLAFLTSKIGDNHRRNLILTFSAVTFLALMSHVLTLEYAPGLIQNMIELPWPLR
jgi:putative tricarboxylic transport membrane protein